MGQVTDFIVPCPGLSVFSVCSCHLFTVLQLQKRIARVSWDSACMEHRSVRTFIDSKGQLLTKWNIEWGWFITSNCFSVWVVWYFVRLVLFFVKYSHLLQVLHVSVVFVFGIQRRWNDTVQWLWDGLVYFKFAQIGPFFCLYPAIHRICFICQYQCM